jgi:DNA repair protein RadC
MAQRRPSAPRTEEPRPQAVEDAGAFLFTIDSSVPVAPAAPRSPPRKRAAAPEAKPHFHDHRARLRQRFQTTSGTGLADYELLELLLFRVIPRRDTKPLAKALIARFGDLAGVLGTDPHRLSEVEGAGDAVAQEIKVLQAVYERAAKAELARRPIISSWTQLLSYCRLAMAQAPREQFRVLFLDSKNQLINDEILSEGTVDHAPVYPREVARRALELSAASVILVHNHPSGDPKPSAADVQITREVVTAAKAIGVNVHDHLVIGRQGAASLKTLGLM